jgi:hypothetical protein
MLVDPEDGKYTLAYEAHGRAEVGGESILKSLRMALRWRQLRAI